MYLGSPLTADTNQKAVIKLQYISEWRREPVEGCSSVWPVKRELFSPMKAALVRILPTSHNKYPALQIQLYGNPVHEGILYGYTVCCEISEVENFLKGDT